MDILSHKISSNLILFYLIYYQLRLYGLVSFKYDQNQNHLKFSKKIWIFNGILIIFYLFCALYSFSYSYKVENSFRDLMVTEVALFMYILLYLCVVCSLLWHWLTASKLSNIFDEFLQIVSNIFSHEKQVISAKWIIFVVIKIGLSILRIVTFNWYKFSIYQNMHLAIFVATIIASLIYVMTESHTDWIFLTYLVVHNIYRKYTQNLEKLLNKLSKLKAHKKQGSRIQKYCYISDQLDAYSLLLWRMNRTVEQLNYCLGLVFFSNITMNNTIIVIKFYFILASFLENVSGRENWILLNVYGAVILIELSSIMYLSNGIMWYSNSVSEMMVKLTDFQSLDSRLCTTVSKRFLDYFLCK